LATKKAIRLCSHLPLMMLCALSMRGQQLPAPTVAVPAQGTVAASQPAEVAYSPPRVSCQGNQLTIDAQNATLGSVLTAVHDCLGVEIILPDGAAEDRSFVRLGPGPTREVLDELLSSTKYSYAIQSSATVPGKIASILVIGASKDASSAPDGVVVPPPPGNGPMTPLRHAWMETVRNAATEAGIVNPDAPAGSDSPASAPTTPSAGTGAGGSSDSPQPSPAADNSAPATAPATPDPGAQTAAQAPSVFAPASSDSTPQAQPGDDLHKQIDSMQQMFEERKKINSQPTPTPPSQ
jgi:hypothetical protein